MLNRLLPYFILCFWLFAAQVASAQTVIYQDDFESGISGWSQNDSDYDNDVTNFLGRFANTSAPTSRTFAVPAGSTQVDIEFDLYRFDSWDTHLSDNFELNINGTNFTFLFGSPTGSGSSGNVSWSYTRTRGPEHFAFANYTTDPWWREQLFNFQITVSNPGANLALTLTGNFDQPESDESIGYDNFLVTANPPITTPPVIVATDDAQTLPFSATAQPNVLNVLTNDTFDGAAPTSFDLSVNAGSTLPPELTFNTTTGDVGVAAGAPAGVYSFDYDICEAGTTNCETATVSITIEPAPVVIVAVDDSATLPFSAAAQPAILNILTNDTFDGAAASNFDLSVYFTSALPPDLTFNTTTGDIGVVAGAPAGTYSFDYYICEAGTTNCEIAAATITITPPPPVVIVAVDDMQTLPFSAAAQPSVLNVITNDTFDGAVPTTFDLSVNAASSLPPQLIFDTVTGGVGVVAGAAAGTYVFDYDICEVGTTNCETATVTIIIEPAPVVIVATDDSATLPFSAAAQANVLNIVTNDTFDGTAPTGFDLSINAASTQPPQLIFNANTGDVSVAAGAPAGTYSFDYDICEVGTTNCDTATVTIIILPASPSLAMTKVASAPGPYDVGDVVTYTYTVTNNGDTIIRDIGINDTHNGSDPAPSPINETLLTDNGTTGDSTDAAPDGSWDVLAPGDVITFTGTYTVTQTDVDNL